MCGLAALIWKNGRTPDHVGGLLAQLEHGLVHRGPDEHIIFVGDGFAVVHRRLAIVDIADGQQPMFACDDQVGIVYNGEVYNYLELRSELEARGYSFRTRSDTEVVLKAFVEFGPAAFERLDGMFAIFLWDLRGGAPGEFHLVRDHMGTKPLYVYDDAARFIVSSELRPITRFGDADLTLDPAGIHAYLSFRYVPGHATIYRNVRRVEAGTRWHIRDGRATRWRYWDLPYTAPAPVKSLDEAAEAFSSLLIDSVREQQMGEVPIALLLSGGLDSSAIAYACHRLGANYHTFNVGFPSVNEFAFSQAVAERFEQKHTTLETTPQEIAALFPAIVDAMDEPMADPACFPLYVLCRDIRRHATVVLSGEGSDELLGGYPQYARLLTAPPASLEAQFTAFLEASWYFQGAEVPVRGGFDPATMRRHFGYFAERPLLDGMLAFDLKTWLPENLLMKADKILMSQSLEGRFPFLSRKIVEFAASLPEEFKWNEVGKLVLRAAMKDALPETVLNRPKMGFSVPVAELLGMLRPRLFDLLSAHRQHEIAETIDLDHVARVAERHFAGDDHSLWLWNMFVLLQWLDSRASDGASTASRTAEASALTEVINRPFVHAAEPAPLRIVSYRWHVPHQYEIQKLPHRFTLLTGTGTGFTDQWEYRQRPLRANVRLRPIGEFERRDYDLAILHFDENVLCPQLSNGTLGDDWGASFEWFLRNIDLPTVAVCHGTVPFVGQYGANPNPIERFEPIEEQRLRLVEALGEIPVICNSHQAAAEWRFRRQRVIWHGLDPREFPPGTHELPVLSHGEDRYRPHYRGFHELRRVKELLGEGVPVASHRHDPVSAVPPDDPSDAALSFRAWVDHLRRYKIYLNTTLRSPMPRSRTEAMLCGAIPVSLRNHDVDRFVAQGVNGFYGDTPEELAEAIRYLLADERARVRMARAARDTAVRTCNISRFLDDWTVMLKELGF